jgi:hypothetical protein
VIVDSFNFPGKSITLYKLQIVITTLKIIRFLEEILCLKADGIHKGIPFLVKPTTGP